MAKSIGKTEVKTKKEIEAISEKIKASRLKFQDIMIPLAVAFILILLTFFVFIPMINSAIEFRSEYEEIRAKQEQLEELEDILNNIDEEKTQEDLLNSKEIIPRNLRVSTFIYYIDVLANQKNLTSRSISATDTQVTIQQEGERREEGRTYLGVSSPLTYSGSLNDILNFLDTLYSASPYIISTDNVSLRGGSGEEWRVTLNVRGYYVPESEIKVNFYSPFEEYTKHEDILDIFRKKSEQL
jgi:hypothetical protein